MIQLSFSLSSWKSPIHFKCCTPCDDRKRIDRWYLEVNQTGIKHWDVNLKRHIAGKTFNNKKDFQAVTLTWLNDASIYTSDIIETTQQNHKIFFESLVVEALGTLLLLSMLNAWFLALKHVFFPTDHSITALHCSDLGTGGWTRALWELLVSNSIRHKTFPNSPGGCSITEK